MSEDAGQQGQEPEGGSDWRGALGELGSDPSFNDYKPEDMVSVPRAVAKSYVESQKLVGKDKMVRPQEGWGDEEWSSFYKELGRPDTPDAYELPEVELPEGFGVDTELQQKILAGAHKAGVTGAQMQGLYQTFMEAQVERHQREAEAKQELTAKWTGELKSKYGANYDARVDLANRALRAAGGEKAESLIEKLKGVEMSDGTPFLSHPVLVEVFGSLGAMMHEGDLLPGDKPSGYGAAKSQEDRKRDLEEFRSKHGQALADEGHPEHEAMTRRYNALIEASIQ